MEVPPTAFIIRPGAAGRTAVCAAFSRAVGISPFTFTRPMWLRMSLRISSDGKSRFVRRWPASSPTTSRPAEARGSAATPPPAPSPTMTTSACLSRLAMSASSRLVLLLEAEEREVRRGLVRRPHDRVERLLLWLEVQPDAGEAEQVPADEVVVPSVERVAERPLERVLANGLEERRRARHEARHLVPLERGQDGISICLGEVREPLAQGGLCVRVERGEVGRVRRQQLPELPGEGTVDVAGGARLCCPQTIVSARDEALDDRF